jgi:phage tail protein X
MVAQIIPAASAVVELEDVVLDDLCFSHLLSVLGDRREAARVKGYVEAAFEANPGLADAGTFLPRGATVQLPEFVIESEDRQTVRLWDY